MEEETNSLLAVCVVDKREVDRKSPNMEKAGLLACLQEISDLGLKVKEITTDAHPQVTAYLKGHFQF